MKITAYIISAVLLVMAGCKDFAELEKNPNVATSVPASLVLTSLENAILEEPWSLEHRYNQYWACNYYYYGNQEYSWTNATLKFDALKDVVKMEEEAKKAGAPDINPYSSLGKFFRARLYVWMTLQVGDLPVKNALKGLDDIAPVYDTQKDLYIQVLKWLDEANTELKAQSDAGNTTLAGDIYLNNDLEAWRKVVNSYTLRVLISLSKKEATDADLNIKSKFAAILSNPDKYPLMQSNNDNLQVDYNGSTSFYPTNPGSKGFDKGRYNMAQTYVKGLTDLKDPRAFVTLNPAKKKLETGTAFDDFAAYVGAGSGESQDDMTFKAGNGEYSYANQIRYYGTFVGPEPAVMLSYAEQCFNIAEGINRGWVPGNAESYYLEGIKASMLFYGIEDGATITVTSQDDDVLGTVTASVTNYLAQPSVKYAGGATGLNQILTQKYLAFFQQGGLEAFYNQRRTGVPMFHVGPGTGYGGSSPRIPKRWLYPSDETTTNKTHLDEALSRQFGGSDTKDGDMWILK